MDHGRENMRVNCERLLVCSIGFESRRHDNQIVDGALVTSVKNG
jgi:hypothetical protein